MVKEVKGWRESYITEPNGWEAFKNNKFEKK